MISGGSRISWGHQSLMVDQFSQKLHENEEILDPGGHVCDPIDPLLIIVHIYLHIYLVPIARDKFSPSIHKCCIFQEDFLSEWGPMVESLYLCLVAPMVCLCQTIAESLQHLGYTTGMVGNGWKMIFTNTIQENEILRPLRPVCT